VTIKNLRYEYLVYRNVEYIHIYIQARLQNCLYEYNEMKTSYNKFELKSI